MGYPKAVLLGGNEKEFNQKRGKLTTRKNRHNDTLNFAGKCMKLENIILSEVTQTQKDSYHMCSFIGGYKT